MDLFEEVNRAIFDLQQSQIQTFERPLKKLVKLLQHKDLKEINEQLTDGLELDTFLAEGAETAGGFAGCQKLSWPEEQRDVLGLSLLLMERFASDPDFAVNFSLDYFFVDGKILASLRSMTSQLIVPFVRDYKIYVKSRGELKLELKKPISNKVFIVHGHDEGARESVARLIERLGLKAVILHEQANQGRTIIEKVEAHGDVGFAVVLLTPDDEGASKGGKTEPRARQNVLLELGYFIGRLGRSKVCTLKKGELEIPSDFAGAVWETMDAAGGWKIALGRELREAGYEVDLNKI